MKLSQFRPVKGASMLRARLILSSVVAAMALSAALASSASAFQWWVGTPGNPMPLVGQLPINASGQMHSPFSLKWLHGYEVKCGGVTYNELFLEGPVSMGAHSIEFEACTVNKPKKPRGGTKVAGGKIPTDQVTGQIKPAGSKVEFVFVPVGTLLSSFTLTQKGEHKVHKSKHHRVRHRDCTINVSVYGQAGGTLGQAGNITTQKTFEFNSKELKISQVRRCHRAPATDVSKTPATAPRTTAPATATTTHQTIEEKECLKAGHTQAECEAARKARQARELEECVNAGRPRAECETEAKEREAQEALELKEEEELEALELREEECEAELKTPQECGAIEAEVKERHQEEAEEKAEEAAELAARPGEEEVKPIEGNKGKSGYSATEGWGVL
jgi:hypothetical protein